MQVNFNSDHAVAKVVKTVGLPICATLATRWTYAEHTLTGTAERLPLINR